MKKLFFFLMLFVSDHKIFAQNLSFDIRGKYSKSVTKAKLAKATKLQDLISEYPSNWIQDYVSVAIISKHNNISQNALGPDQVLTSQQIEVLRSLELESEIEIIVTYKNKNTVTDQVFIDNMLVKLTVVPDIEAAFEGGYAALKEYLKASFEEKLLKNTPEKFRKGKIYFTINEDGKVTDTQIMTSSDDSKTDEFLLTVINNMPLWKPAETINGRKVKQLFVFNLSFLNDGC